MLKKKLIIFFSIVFLISFIFTNNLIKLINMPTPKGVNKFTFLTNCIKKNCDIKDYISTQKRIINSTVYDFDVMHESYYQFKEIHEQGLEFKKLYFSESNRNLIFLSIDHMPLSEILFMQTKSWYFHPISYIFSDFNVKKLRENIIKFNKNIKENQYIMFYDSSDLHPVEREIINSIKKDWKFCLIEEGKRNVSVYLLMDINKAC